MIKRLLNPNILLKITLILTTLLLLPCTAWADITYGGQPLTFYYPNDSDPSYYYSGSGDNKVIEWNAKLIGSGAYESSYSGYHNFTDLRFTYFNPLTGPLRDIAIVGSETAIQDANIMVYKLSTPDSEERTQIGTISKEGSTYTYNAIEEDQVFTNEYLQLAIESKESLTSQKFITSGITSITLSFSGTDYGISVGSFRITSNNASNVLGDATPSVSYDSENNKLTLNNANINGSITSSREELTIELTGMNTLRGSIEDVHETYHGNLNITGTGSLEITGHDGAAVIRYFDDVTIADGLYIQSNTPGTHWDYDCFRGGGTLVSEMTITPAVYYPIWVVSDGVEYIQVSDVNKTQVLGEGNTRVTYNNDQLILNGFTCSTTDGEPAIYLGDQEEFKIYLLGNNTITGFGVSFYREVAFLTVSTDKDNPGTLTLPDNGDFRIANIPDDCVIYENGLGLYNHTISTVWPRLVIGDTQIMGTTDKVMNDENISFDAGTNTLTLSGTTIGSENSETDIDVYVKDLIVAINGTNTVYGRFYGNYFLNGNRVGTIHFTKAEGATSPSITISGDTDYYGPVYEFSQCTWDNGLYLTEAKNAEGGMMYGVYYGSDRFTNVNDSTPKTVKISNEPSASNVLLWIGNRKISGSNENVFGEEDDPEILKGRVKFAAGENGGTLVLDGAMLSDNPIVSSLSSLTIIFKGSTQINKIISVNSNATLTFGLAESAEDNAFICWSFGESSLPWKGFAGNPTFENKLVYLPNHDSQFLKVLEAPTINYSDGWLAFSGLSDGFVNNFDCHYTITYGEGDPDQGSVSVLKSSVEKLLKPCTITAYVEYTDKFNKTTQSNIATAKYFGFETEELTVPYQASVDAPAIFPALPSGVTKTFSNAEGLDIVPNPIDPETGAITITELTEGDPYVYEAIFTAPQNVDYTVLNKTYSVNSNPETPVVESYYLGSFSVAVTKRDLKDVTIEDIPNQTFTGSEIRPKLYVKNGTLELQEAKTADDGDYTISYSNNTAAALATAENAPTVTITGKGNYTGTVTKTFTITAKSLDGAKVTLADNKTEFTYNEAANVPTITQVSLTEETGTTLQLTAGTDYTLSYVKVTGETEEAIEADKIINAGSYKMILTGKGNFSGTKEVAFTITPRTITNLILALSATSFTYNGEAQKPTVTVQFEETELEATKGTTKTIPTTDYDLTFSGECINAGTYSVSASLKGNYSGSGDGPSFTITKATISPKVTLAGWTYGATANEPSVSGNTGNGEVTYAYKLQNEAESAFAAAVPTNAGAYTVKASIAATANYEAASDTAQFIIAKATPTLSFSATTASLTMDEEVTGLPTLSNPSGLAVTYTSSNSEVAKISEDGTVTPVAPGETTISATIATSNNYEGISASYVLTVNKSKRYGLKVGDTEVTEDNKNDILGDGDLDANKRPTFLFNPTDTTLLVINSEEGLTIESRLPELKIHLTGEKNKLKSIIFNNQDNTENIGKLIFTSDDAFPGKVTIANTAGESAIRGFESISFAEICKLLILSPEEAVYQNGTIGADTVIIGQLINPMTNGTTVTFNNDDFTVINPDGTQEEADLSSYTSNEIHYTLPGTTDGQGYDASTNTITVIDAMNDEEVQKIAKAAKDNTTTVGSGEYAQQFIGLTFMVAGGEGDIEIDQEVIPGYAFHLKIGEDTPKALGEGVAGRLLAKEHYKVDAATYCWLYLVENAVAASRAVARKWGDTRVGKRDRMHGAIYSVSVKPNKVKSANPPSQASGGVIPAAEGDKIETEGIQGVKVVNTVDDRWFTIDGRQIDKPTQKGLYIHNRKKVVVK